MEFILNFLIWSPDPDMFKIPIFNHPVRWYGLLFAGGFIVSQQILFWIYRKEGRPEKDVEKLTVYMVAATIIGARLGHCLFYNPGYYLSHPVEIIKVWEGGLASHGGALGIFVALFLYVRKYPQYPILWLCDRLVIVVAITGAMIRLGNFFNSEMEGQMTNSEMGVVYAYYSEQVLKYNDSVEDVEFIKGGELSTDEPGKYPITARLIYKKGVTLGPNEQMFFQGQLQKRLLNYDEVTQHIDFGQGKPLAFKFYEKDGHAVADIYALGIPRHAAQLYESTYCLLLALLTFLLWKVKRHSLPLGFNFAIFMTLLWVLRFVDEFFKMNQEAFEEGMALNMGQILSIPMALSGLLMLYWFSTKGKFTMSLEPRNK